MTTESRDEKSVARAEVARLFQKFQDTDRLETGSRSQALVSSIFTHAVKTGIPLTQAHATTALPPNSASADGHRGLWNRKPAAYPSRPSAPPASSLCRRLPDDVGS